MRALTRNMKSTFAAHSMSPQIIYTLYFNHTIKIEFILYHDVTGLVPFQRSCQSSFHQALRFQFPLVFQPSFRPCRCLHQYQSKRSRWTRSSYFLVIHLPFYIESRQKGCCLHLTLNLIEIFQFFTEKRCFLSRRACNLYTIAQ